MLRRLAITSTAVLASLALVSSASAMIPIDPGYGSGSGSTPLTSTPGGFPWANVAIGVALAAVVAVCLAGAFYVSRNRRRLAALHS